MIISKKNRQELIDRLVEEADADFLIDEYCDLEELAEAYSFDLSHREDDDLLAEYIEAFGNPEWLVEAEQSAEPSPPDPLQLHMGI